MRFRRHTSIPSTEQVNSGTSDDLRICLPLAIAVIFVLQLGLLFLVNRGAPVKTVAANSQTAVETRFVILDPTQEPLLLELLDPTLFLLPNPRAFSGRVWELDPPVTEEPQIMKPEPMFLSMYPIDLLKIAHRIAGIKVTPNFEFARKHEVEEGIDLQSISTPVVSGTRVEVRGELRGRKIITMPTEGNLEDRAPLPAPPTVVTVGVDNDGLPISVIIETSSGLPPLDGLALKIVSAMRWEPLLGSGNGIGSIGVQWGKVAFYWGTRLQLVLAGNTGNYE